jgi:ABC-type spermidine/putrescine transport system permease subunit II
VSATPATVTAPPVAPEPVPARAARAPKSPLRPRYLKLHAVLVYLFLFAPIIVLVVFSFNRGRSGTKFTGFSTAGTAISSTTMQSLPRSATRSR